MQSFLAGAAAASEALASDEAAGIRGEWSASPITIGGAFGAALGGTRAALLLPPGERWTSTPSDGIHSLEAPRWKRPSVADAWRLPRRCSISTAASSGPIVPLPSASSVSKRAVISSMSCSSTLPIRTSMCWRNSRLSTSPLPSWSTVHGGAQTCGQRIARSAGVAGSCPTLPTVSYELWAHATRDELGDGPVTFDIHERSCNPAKCCREPADGEEQVEDEEDARRGVGWREVTEADGHARHQREVEAIAPRPALGEVHDGCPDKGKQEQADEGPTELLQMDVPPGKSAFNLAQAFLQPIGERTQHCTE